MKATNPYSHYEPYPVRKSKIPSIFMLSFLLILMHSTCAPPRIQKEAVRSSPEVTLDSIYSSSRNYLNTPIRLTCIVNASFFIQGLGGFYFVEGINSEKAIIVFTKQPPPQQDAEVSIFGVAKPALLKDDHALLYFKEKEVFLLSEPYAY